jgi:hypothetical protein
MKLKNPTSEWEVPTLIIPICLLDHVGSKLNVLYIWLPLLCYKSATKFIIFRECVQCNWDDYCCSRKYSYAKRCSIRPLIKWISKKRRQMAWQHHKRRCTILWTSVPTICSFVFRLHDLLFHLKHVKQIPLASTRAFFWSLDLSNFNLTVMKNYSHVEIIVYISERVKSW